MTRGFGTGLVQGTVMGVAALAALSLIAPLPEGARMPPEHLEASREAEVGATPSMPVAKAPEAAVPDATATADGEDESPVAAPEIAAEPQVVVEAPATATPGPADDAPSAPGNAPSPTPRDVAQEVPALIGTPLSRAGAAPQPPANTAARPVNVTAPAAPDPAGAVDEAPATPVTAGNGPDSSPPAPRLASGARDPDVELPSPPPLAAAQQPAARGADTLTESDAGTDAALPAPDLSLPPALSDLAR